MSMNHKNARCYYSTPYYATPPRVGKSISTNWTTSIANCHDIPILNDEYGHYNINVKIEDGKQMDDIADSIAIALDNTSIKTKPKVMDCAKIFEDKTGWTVYGARLEREDWVVEDRGDCCWSGDAYEDILKIFETSINLESILWKLKDALYISNYRKSNELLRDMFEYRLQDWIVELVNNNLKNESDEFYKRVFTEEKVNNMGLRIKKTDVLSIDEFKENDKAYDEIRICIDKEMFEEYKRDYGLEPFDVKTKLESGEKYIDLENDTIEYLPKALSILPDGWGICVKSIPYEYITKVECTYYLKTE